MSLAASIVLLAAAVLPSARAAPTLPPAPSVATEARPRVVASASARVVILRPAIISFDLTGGTPQSANAVTRQTTRRGTRVAVEFY